MLKSYSAKWLGFINLCTHQGCSIDQVLQIFGVWINGVPLYFVFACVSTYTYNLYVCVFVHYIPFFLMKFHFPDFSGCLHNFVASCLLATDYTVNYILCTYHCSHTKSMYRMCVHNIKISEIYLLLCLSFLICMHVLHSGCN